MCVQELLNVRRHLFGRPLSRGLQLYPVHNLPVHTNLTEDRKLNQGRLDKTEPERGWGNGPDDTLFSVPESGRYDPNIQNHGVGSPVTLRPSETGAPSKVLLDLSVLRTTLSMSFGTDPSDHRQ